MDYLSVPAWTSPTATADSTCAGYIIHPSVFWKFKQKFR